MTAWTSWASKRANAREAGSRLEPRERVAWVSRSRRDARNRPRQAKPWEHLILTRKPSGFSSDEVADCAVRHDRVHRDACIAGGAKPYPDRFDRRRPPGLSAAVASLTIASRTAADRLGHLLTISVRLEIESSPTVPDSVPRVSTNSRFFEESTGCSSPAGGTLTDL